jgi:hypothetical protein
MDAYSPRPLAGSDAASLFLPPGVPAADPSTGLPANPFSEISDGAIEYFVEWSLEKNTGANADQKAVFANVAMELPHDEPVVEPARPPRRSALLLGGVFVAGALAGGVADRALFKAPAPVVVATPAPAASPAPVAEEEAEEVPAKKAGSVSLAIRSTPPGAEIVLDGNSAGTTPQELQVAPGSHQLQLTRDRYASHEATVRAPGELDVVLKRPLATLSVRSTPAGANVQVRNTPRGVTPLDLKLPAYENYEVRVVFSDGRAAKKQVYLKPPSQEISANLPATKKK